MIEKLETFPNEVIYEKYEPVYNDSKYQTDIANITCSCPDWNKRRFYFPLLDPRRMCKHLIKAYLEEGFIHVDYRKLETQIWNYYHNEKGYPLVKRQFFRVGFKTYEVQINNNSNWLVIVTDINTVLYHKVENRWSDDSDHPKLAKLEKALLKLSLVASPITTGINNTSYEDTSVGINCYTKINKFYVALKIPRNASHTAFGHCSLEPFPPQFHTAALNNNPVYFTTRKQAVGFYIPTGDEFYSQHRRIKSIMKNLDKWVNAELKKYYDNPPPINPELRPKRKSKAKSKSKPKSAKPTNNLGTVYFEKSRQRWKARRRIDGKQVYVGRYLTEEEAWEALKNLRDS